MRMVHLCIGSKLRYVVLCLLLWLPAGCATFGSTSISMGRASYNEAINKTEDEQLLMAIVRSRYGELYSLLSVTGVAANVRFGTNAGINLGFGNSEDYATNLVPFSGGIIYEENPTITYAPVQSEQFYRQILTPLSMDLLLLLVRATLDPTKTLIVLVNRINDLNNPDFLPTSSAKPDQRFIRFIELTAEFRKAFILDWVKNPDPTVEFDIIISHYAPQYTPKVREYLDLLNVPLPVDKSKDIILPVYFAVRGKGWKGVGMSTRSTEDLLEILRASIELPEEHIRQGIALDYPPLGLAGQNLRIRTSKSRPEKSSLATKYRGYWFYIDDGNLTTKEFFQFVKIFWTVSSRASADQKAAPVLTIPVGGGG